MQVYARCAGICPGPTNFISGALNLFKLDTLMSKGIMSNAEKETLTCLVLLLDLDGLSLMLYLMRIN